MSLSEHVYCSFRSSRRDCCVYLFHSQPLTQRKLFENVVAMHVYSLMIWPCRILLWRVSSPFILFSKLLHTLHILCRYNHNVFAILHNQSPTQARAHTRDAHTYAYTHVSLSLHISLSSPSLVNHSRVEGNDVSSLFRGKLKKVKQQSHTNHAFDTPV